MSTSAKPSPVPAAAEAAATDAAATDAAAVPRRDDDVRSKLAIRKAYHTAYYEYQRRDMMYLLIILRFINAITIRTFFQPDEYFQSLEPAWEMAFGASSGAASGAWITWEWHHQLRSSLHPAIFALLYFVADRAMGVMSMYPQFKAIILAYLPRVFQGLVAAVGDYYTWQLAEKVYGQGSNAAFTTLLITALSPWQWFCSTRTLSNSLETVLTIVALYHWPWALYGDSSAPRKASPDAAEAHKATTSSPESQIFKTHADVNSLRICLFLAGIACLLRPTNLFIWASIVTVSVSRLGLTGTSPAKFSDFLIILRETVICGALALSISAASDYYYFGVWTFPPYQWLYFNITKSLAVFYGTNRWDYYLTEGLPLLLTTCVPFTLIAFVSSTSIGTDGASVSNIRFQFTFTALTTIATLSLISHKEVRFIYPLLPLLHILSAPHILSFFSRPAPASTPSVSTFAIPPSPTLRRTTLLGALIALNISLAFYTTLIHQRGVLDVLSFLRYDYEATHLTERGLFIPTTADDAPFAAFLMPCHSTPWRSHLVHPTLNAWALTCEPPLDIPAGTPEREAYRDEADRFFDNPKGFLSREVGSREKPWPQYVVGFEGIEGVLVEWHEETGSQYEVVRKWSGFNSHWIDDERRQGRVVVWEFKERVKA
ncbi:glycosylphosphatidylinositol anchor biosynthesis [Pseudogymnoascus destructans]|uniref:Mannosyltransferase n=1 Tax=Pseudogymnoascus destructans TaxID=655981 RepID=A0A177AD75_9PEZI|nr:glycosylphosphatidylinositol anchor biosynthesis [Pseudogymnoascus destructans]OAF60017.1 glycosylphosphatidylinositol anchor biosynthesis [Pseudogymnoascus destructans]